MKSDALARELKAHLIARLALRRALVNKRRRSGEPSRVDLERQYLEKDWRDWLMQLVPRHFTRRSSGEPIPFAPHHEEFWDWVWSLTPGVRPRPFISVLARGGGKSTGCELATIALGAREVRRYALYISGTQDQADKHVDSIAGVLEGPELARVYPDMANRLVGKYGTAKGWRRNRLRCRNGFTVDALGLDVRTRGVKLEETRPDLIIFDDLDDAEDGPLTIATKLRRLALTFLPAGSRDVAVLGVQNLQHRHSVFSRFVDGRADFLMDRQLCGPVPALRQFTYEFREGKYWIKTGEPTWAGQDREACQDLLHTIGLTAFLRECQHDTLDAPGGMFDHLTYQRCTWAELPALVRIVVWVDPAVTDTDQSDSQGIQADALGVDGRVYRLWSWEQRTGPQDAMERALLKAVELKAEHVGVETDQGGDAWESVYREAVRKLELSNPPAFTSDKAGAGHGSKVHRAGLMLASYERGEIVHVLGTHDVLERAQHRFPKTKPLDLVDTSYWSWQDLKNNYDSGVS